MPSDVEGRLCLPPVELILKFQPSGGLERRKVEKYSRRLEEAYNLTRTNFEAPPEAKEIATTIAEDESGGSALRSTACTIRSIIADKEYKYQEALAWAHKGAKLAVQYFNLSKNAGQFVVAEERRKDAESIVDVLGQGKKMVDALNPVAGSLETPRAEETAPQDRPSGNHSPRHDSAQHVGIESASKAAQAEDSASQIDTNRRSSRQKNFLGVTSDDLKGEKEKKAWEEKRAWIWKLIREADKNKETKLLQELEPEYRARGLTWATQPEIDEQMNQMNRMSKENPSIVHQSKKDIDFCPCWQCCKARLAEIRMLDTFGNTAQIESDVYSPINVLQTKVAGMSDDTPYEKRTKHFFLRALHTVFNMRNCARHDRHSAVEALRLVFEMRHNTENERKAKDCAAEALYLVMMMSSDTEAAIVAKYSAAEALRKVLLIESTPAEAADKECGLKALRDMLDMSEDTPAEKTRKFRMSENLANADCKKRLLATGK